MRYQRKAFFVQSVGRERSGWVALRGGVKNLQTTLRFCSPCLSDPEGAGITGIETQRRNRPNKSLVVYRLVHPPVTRESGVRLPARETLFLAQPLLLSAVSHPTVVSRQKGFQL